MKNQTLTITGLENLKKEVEKLAMQKISTFGSMTIVYKEQNNIKDGEEFQDKYLELMDSLKNRLWSFVDIEE